MCTDERTCCGRLIVPIEEIRNRSVLPSAEPGVESEGTGDEKAGVARGTGRCYGSRCWAMLSTVPSGARTKKRRIPHGSVVRG